MPLTYEPIATTTLGVAASEIIFSSIPGTYTDLKIIFTFVPSAGTYPSLQFNSDTGTNYSWTRLSGDGTTAASARAVTTSFIRGGVGITATNPILFSVDVFSYANSTFKTALTDTSNDQNGTGRKDIVVGLWRNTAAITSVRIFPATGNFNIGSTATIYGIKNA
jgi:hypothetical protein